MQAKAIAARVDSLTTSQKREFREQGVITPFRFACVALSWRLWAVGTCTYSRLPAKSLLEQYRAFALGPARFVFMRRVCWDQDKGVAP